MEIDSTAAGLQIAVGRLVRRLRQTHVPGDLTLSEASVLFRLDQDGATTPGELATGERIKPQAMATTLQTLEQRTLISRAPDPGDGRRVVITITDVGRRLLTDRRTLKSHALAEAIGRLTDDEQRALTEASRLLNRLAEQL